jgi:DNA polymerase III subunit delta
MAPVHLLVGDDDLLLQRELERLLDDLRGEEPELAAELHDVSETDHLPELRTASLFGGRTCVVLRGAEGLSGALKDEVERYLGAPSDEAVLVLVARGVGRIQKVAKLVKEHGSRQDVKTPADWDERAWDRLVGEEFRRLHRKADATAIAAVRAHAGTSPATIASQVAQVCAAEAGAPVLTAEHVEQVVEGHGRTSGFAVADAVAARDPAGTLVALRGCLEAGESPLALLGAVTFRFRQLLQVRGGASPKDAGLSPGQHRRLQAVARSFHPGELAWCHDQLAQLDVDLKGSELPDALVLELGLVEVATSREVGAPFNPIAAREAVP